MSQGKQQPPRNLPESPVDTVRLLQRFAAEMQALPPVILTVVPAGRPEEDTLAMSPAGLWSLLALLQMALRHPEMNPDNEAAVRAARFIAWARAMFIPENSAMAEILERGFLNLE